MSKEYLGFALLGDDPVIVSLLLISGRTPLGIIVLVSFSPLFSLPRFFPSIKMIREFYLKKPQVPFGYTS